MKVDQNTEEEVEDEIKYAVRVIFNAGPRGIN